MNCLRSADRASDCPLFQQLDSLAGGTLAGDELESVLEAVERCETCRAEYETQCDGSPLQQSAQVRGSASGVLAEEESGRPIAKDRQTAALSDGSKTGVAIDSDATVQMPVPEDRPPETIGTYQITGVLGKGGMGTVYKAVHPQLEKTVAIKLIGADCITNTNAVARFQREMRVVGRLDHPNIIRATDAGTAEGRQYLVMEFVDGSDLKEIVDRHGPLPINDACDIIYQTAIGLHHAHENALVHRDIKPSNIMLTRSGVAKLLDMGLARVTWDEDPAGEQLTGAGQICGTIDFMPPEQWESTHDVDARGDLYSLGCTLFYILTGSVPFGGASYRSVAKKMKAHLLEAAPAVTSIRAEIPAELGQIVAKTLLKQPSERFATSLEFAEALQQFRTDCNPAALVDGKATPGTLPTPAPSSSNLAQPLSNSSSQTLEAEVARKSKAAIAGWVVGAAGFVLAMTAVIGVMFNRGGGETPPTPDSTIAESAAPESADVDNSRGDSVTPPSKTPQTDPVDASTAVASIGPDEPVAKPEVKPVDPTPPKTIVPVEPSPTKTTVTPPKPPEPKPVKVVFADIELVNIKEGEQFSYRLRPANSEEVKDKIRFALSADAPKGTQIDARTGVFQWKPDEQQGPGTHSITVNVTPTDSLVLGEKVVFQVKVAELNMAPELAKIAQQSVDEGTPLSLATLAKDADLPANTLTYALEGDVPKGMRIDSGNGRFQWTPTEKDGPDKFQVTVRATDNGVPAQSASQTFTIAVRELNTPPKLAPIEKQSVGPGEAVELALVGSDADLPAQTLTYKLGPGAPETAAFDERTGRLKWRSPPDEIGKAYRFEVTVSDDAQKSLSATQEVLLEVDRYVSNSIGMKLAYIPAGKFFMGNTERKRAFAPPGAGAGNPLAPGAPGNGRPPRNPFGSGKNGGKLPLPGGVGNARGPDADETPVRSIKMARPFHIGAHEVTQTEFEKIMQSNPSHFSKQGSGRDLVDRLEPSRFPVESVSWEQAVEFCKKLSALPAEKKAGRVYRLPTEAEWEYSCRGGTKEAYHFGELLSSKFANFDGAFGSPGTIAGPYLKRPTVVGSFPQNPFGLFDMHGNVGEWCADWYSATTYNHLEAENPQGPPRDDAGTVKANLHRVIRGGNWRSDASECRSSRRDHGEGKGRNDIGFRVVCDIRTPQQAAR
ncbi:MAG: hypothetical protein CMJ48_08670 [Planctomycetaceae bacterium]|nr:hypothetical protein [Planctomycetaceae bacterium]